MGLEENKVLARRYVEEIIAGKLDKAHEVFTEDFRYHRPNGNDSVGRQIYLDNFVTALLEALPDWRAEIVAMVAEGDIVSDRVAITATLNGEPFAGEAAHFWRIRDGRIAEGWTVLPASITQGIAAAVAARRARA